MIRPIQIAAVAVLLASPALAHAAPAADVSVPYKSAELATASGRAAIKVRVGVVVERICTTIAYGTPESCRRAVMKQLTDEVDARAAQYAAAHLTVQLSQR